MGACFSAKAVHPATRAVEPLESRLLFAAGGLHIVLEEGPNLRANAQAAAAFRRAADFLQNLFSDPITVVVDAEIAPLPGNVIGQTSSVELHLDPAQYSHVRDLMIADAAPNESIVSRLPTLSQLKFIFPPHSAHDPFSFAGISATRAQLLALGMTPSDVDSGPTSDYNASVKRDMSMTFNSNFSFDYSPTDGISAGKTDFTGVVAHEMCHGLGFLSEIDNADFLMDRPTLNRSLFPTPLDLFRLRPGAGAADFTNSPRILAPGSSEPYQVIYDGGVYQPPHNFFIAGLTRGDIPMSTGSSHGDGNQASHWKDNDQSGVYIGAMDPTAAPGAPIEWTAADTRALGLVGWDVNPAGFGSISGAVFNDRSGDGVQQAGESGIAGAAVWLDFNNNGRQDGSEPSSVTDSAGKYSFTGLAPETFIVREKLPAGATSASPSSSSTPVTVVPGHNTVFNFAASTATSATTSLLAPWTARDIGAVGIAGSSSMTSSSFTITAGGSDFFGKSDSGRFVFQTLSGDGDIVARVSSIGNTNPFAKAGVMIRQGLSAGSKDVLLAMTRSNGIRLIARPSDRTAATSSSSPGAVPKWLRLARSGSKFTAYTSSDGAHWQVAGSTTISMSGSVLIGLAVSSHNLGAASTCGFDNVRITRGSHL